jgi:hypothetical protein
LGICTYDEINNIKTSIKNNMKNTNKRKAINTTIPKKGTSNVKNIVLVGAGLTATGIVGYFGFQYFKKLKEQEMLDAKKKAPISTFTPPANDTPNYPTEPTYTPPKEPIYYPSDTNKTNSNSSNSTSNNTYSAPKPKAEFPLKRGGKSANIKALQFALIATYGKSILPKYGADGDFGKELAVALKKLNYPSAISESLFHVITGGKVTDTSLAQQFYSALNKYDYSTTMSLLAQLKNKTDYTAVSNEFRNFRLHGGVRQTLVNGTLNTFSDATQKQNIRIEFIRMGLKYNGKKWSLDGIGGTKIITTEPTQIWLDGYSSIQVPSNMILGIAHAEKLDFTLFENDNKFFLVKTNAIRKIN